MQEADFAVEASTALSNKDPGSIFATSVGWPRARRGKSCRVYPVLLAEVGDQVERHFSFLPSGGRLDLFLVSLVRQVRCKGWDGGKWICSIPGRAFAAARNLCWWSDCWQEPPALLLVWCGLHLPPALSPNHRYFWCLSPRHPSNCDKNKGGWAQSFC